MRYINKKLLLVAILEIFIGFSLITPLHGNPTVGINEINGNSIGLKYGRIRLITNLNYNKHKTLIDSIFVYIDESLRKTEIQIGYKITSEIEIILEEEFLAYQRKFKESKIYAEQHNLTTQFSSEKILPLFIAQSFYAIKCDVKFLVTYIVLDEFLHGVGVKQRLNQGDAVRLPNWLIHGYCYESSIPWNAKDADQYIKYQENGYYRNINKIPAEAQATFGKYIWHNILLSSDKNTESTIWFTVKYTNQLNEAFLFQFKQTFDEWYDNLPIIISKTESISSDIQLPNEFADKIIQKITFNSKNSSLMLLSDESSDLLVNFTDKESYFILKKFDAIEHINPWYRKAEYQLWYDTFTSRYTFCIRSGLTVYSYQITNKGVVNQIDSTKYNLSDVNHGLTISLKTILTDNFNSFYNSIPGAVTGIFSDDFVSKDKTTYLLTTSIIRDENAPKSSISVSKILNLLTFYKFENGNFTSIRTDSLAFIPTIGSLMTENDNRISYTVSQNNQWKLNFIEFNKNDDLQWNMGYSYRFFKHNKDANNRIIEMGFQSNKSIIRLIDNWQESKQEVIRLYKQKDQKLDTLDPLIIDSIKVQPILTGFNYLSNFTQRNWQSKLSQQSINQYVGKFDLLSITPGYFLKHAGVFLNNYENREFVYFNKIPLANLNNSPFTPIIRLHIADKLNQHNIRLTMLSNIIGTRMGMELNQGLKLSQKYSISHHLWWRNRNFLSTENNFIRNSSLENKLGINKYWSDLFFSAINGELRYDAFYSRISNLSQTILPSSKNTYGKLFLSIGISSLKKTNEISIHRWNYQVKLSTGPGYFFENKRNNWEFKFQGNIQKSIGKHLNYQNRFAGNYSLGKTQTLYLLGGSDGWIGNSQFIDGIPALKTNSEFKLIGFGLPIRGFIYGSRIGSSFISIQQQLEIELFKSLINKQIKNIFISDLTAYTFCDAGMAFIDNSPQSLSNPYHTKQISTSNYQLWYTSLHNPWIYSFGIGTRTYIMGFPLKYEISFPIMDKKIQKTQHLIGLQWDF